MDWTILNTLDISGAPEAKDTLEAVGSLISVAPVRDEVLKHLPSVNAYMASASIRVDQEFLDLAPDIKVIGSPSTGTDHMDLDLIRARGIDVFDIAKERDLLNSFSATSELGFGILLALVRKIPQGVVAVKRGDWARERLSGFQLLGKTLGILGLGRLGSISARIGQGFAMNVIAHDVADKSMTGVEMVDFDTLLERSDILMVHIHLRPETDGMIGADEFKKMKPSAIVVNTSRGRIINEAALVDALHHGEIAGAALDVIDGEWLSSEELAQHPLILYAQDHENLMIVPHIGGSTKESIYGARVFMAEKLAAYIRDKKSIAK